MRSDQYYNIKFCSPNCSYYIMPPPSFARIPSRATCVPANARQCLPSAAQTDGCAAELSLFTRVARSINTSTQHIQTTSRVPVSEEGKGESQIFWHKTATKRHTQCTTGHAAKRVGPMSKKDLILKNCLGFGGGEVTNDGIHTNFGKQSISLFLLNIIWFSDLNH